MSPTSKQSAGDKPAQDQDAAAAVAAEMTKGSEPPPDWDAEAERDRIRSELEQEARDREAQLEAERAAHPQGFYEQPEGYVAPEDRETTPRLPGEHPDADVTMEVTRDVPLPNGGTQPVTSKLPVTPAGDPVAI